MKKGIIIAILTLIISPFLSISQSNEADKIVGTWLVGSGKAHIQIYKYVLLIDESKCPCRLMNICIFVLRSSTNTKERVRLRQDSFEFLGYAELSGEILYVYGTINLSVPGSN